MVNAPEFEVVEAEVGKHRKPAAAAPVTVDAHVKREVAVWLADGKRRREGGGEGEGGGGSEGGGGGEHSEGDGDGAAADGKGTAGAGAAAGAGAGAGDVTATLQRATQSTHRAAEELRQVVDLVSLLKGSRNQFPKLYQAIPTQMADRDNLEQFANARLLMNVARKQELLRGSATTLREASSRLRVTVAADRKFRGQLAALSGLWPVRVQPVPAPGGPYRPTVPCVFSPHPMVLADAGTAAASAVRVQHPLAASPVSVEVSVTVAGGAGVDGGGAAGAGAGAGDAGHPGSSAPTATVVSTYTLPVQPASSALSSVDASPAFRRLDASCRAVTHSALCHEVMRRVTAQARHLVTAVSASDGFNLDNGAVWWSVGADGALPDSAWQQLAGSVSDRTLTVHPRRVDVAADAHTTVTVGLVPLPPSDCATPATATATPADHDASMSAVARGVVAVLTDGLQDASPAADTRVALGRAVSLVRHKLRLGELLRAVEATNALLAPQHTVLTLQQPPEQHSRVWHTFTARAECGDVHATFTVDVNGPLLTARTGDRSRLCTGVDASAAVLADVCLDVVAWARDAV